MSPVTQPTTKVVKEGLKVPFSELAIGKFFDYQGIVLFKTEDCRLVGQEKSPRFCNAINIITGHLNHLNQTQLVQPLNAVIAADYGEILQGEVELRTVNRERSQFVK